MDIFERRLENRQLKGLVDCSSPSELIQTYENLKQTWLTRHPCGKKFTSYFEKNKLDLIKETMAQNIRSMAGLGFPPEVYNKNGNECMNSVLKRDTLRDKKRMTISEFINHCWCLERRQRTQEELAMIGRGELKVLEEYSDLCCEDVKFFRKSEEQKKVAHSRFFNAEVRPTKLRSLLDVENHDEDTASLSVLPENSKILSVPYPIVKEIFRDGAELLLQNKSIVTAPGPSGTSFYVTNTSDNSKPYCVKRVSAGNATGGSLFKCDKHCLLYTGVHLCSHVIAVAEYIKELQEFLHAFNTSAVIPNLTSLTNNDMPKGRGKKANKATQKRKGPANAPKKPILETYVSSTNPTSAFQQVQPPEMSAIHAAPHQQNPGSGKSSLPPVTMRIQSDNPVAASTNSFGETSMPFQIDSFQSTEQTSPESSAATNPSHNLNHVSSSLHNLTPYLQLNNPVGVAANVSSTHSTVGKSMPSQFHHFQPTQAIDGNAAVNNRLQNRNPVTQSLHHITTHFQANSPAATPKVMTTSTNSSEGTPRTPMIQNIPRPSPPPGIFVLYLLKFCDPRVSRCYGCGSPSKPMALLIFDQLI